MYIKCVKKQAKNNALARIAPFMGLKQGRSMKAFVEPEFGY